ncbi:starch synthase [Ruminiclostridium sufflavum DSM 19573]|uniref:Glycogen synthase n=1 Tax=Ruminiclostridium sufflavum DSM 19573 TaxID=1121337 RepID=A0A318XJX7_9FIRM|nr:glycogen/starch synthase [Ruminiclostridium sufflavum]PYG86836.1 starch synthase [Ruminiclostridium sufflavum DSM 19573]
MKSNKKQLKVLFVSAEVDPFAKTGGLADVAGSLPKELSVLGHDVRIVMPRYGVISTNAKYVADIPVEIGHRTETCVIKESNIFDEDNREVPIYFIENHNYFNRKGIYCYFDDAQRFILLCKAALEMLPAIGFKPDIIHCNDWHTGPICLLLKEKYQMNDFYKDISTIYTVHNLEYQGNFSADVTRYLNLKEGYFVPEKAEFYGMFSFMKCGLVYSDIISTVSKKYAEEILTEEYGEKMEGVLNSRKEDLFGIVNGISYEEFNPGKDKCLFANFDKGNAELKKLNKQAIQDELNLHRSQAPLMGIVTRLTGQKGLELLLGCIDDLIIKENVQLIVLGLGDECYHNAFSELQKKYPLNVAAFFEFNAALAKKIYAACDMFLMPSRFEPCGLGQIISLRYGTIPVVRATGGLAETIIDYDENNSEGNGFSFDEFSVSEFDKTIQRAVNVYKNKPEIWQKLILRALNSDFSWKKPTKAYLELYESAVERKNKGVLTVNE